ncbi:winged helix-turn-helix domain-containing protein [Azonexus sp. IMCC34839]|uniref:winged helix-turn-helix domain-containing protein n=1 Tax=Azonexus sp. IMCC34839 TaxID=3133695 RepID=UPI00399B8466
MPVDESIKPSVRRSKEDIKSEIIDFAKRDGGECFLVDLAKVLNLSIGTVRRCLDELIKAGKMRKAVLPNGTQGHFVSYVLVDAGSEGGEV